MSFVEKHGLWSDAQRNAAADILDRMEKDGLEIVRLSFPDLHGVLRGKAVLPLSLPAAMRDGLSLTSTLLLKDSAHRTVVPVFTAGAGIDMPELQGGADIVMVPDPLTFKILPWAAGTGWMLCDLYFADGRKVPFSTRHLCRDMIDRLGRQGHDFVSGLEVEFHITRLVDAKLGLEDAGQPGNPPEVSLLHQGYNYLTEQRLDQMEPILEILRRDIVALGLPLGSIELEFGPSQCEFVFRAGIGMQPADDMILFRSAVKQICQRHGYHATFMCRPALPNIMSSGWHLHQSLSAGGRNVFAAEDGGAELSMIGRHYLAGLLAGAREAAAFTTPTINGYKRYRANSLAPDRVAWGRENRGALLRVITGTSPQAARIENRAGEPAANPYLYLASQIASGLAGLAAGQEPPAGVDSPYQAEAPMLPTTLEAALTALDGSTLFRTAFGDRFVDYFLMIKRSEVARYNAHVTDWEQREYFNLF
ncbi:glutamine synthetase family protein [Flavisphingomonas formosensis]|uniref:glutamine synthetase family protein n=1 Tax=Flavisphingomonas formosensis TaxID=861534 RepID=UPI0012F96527|nr:glutamine synthetase family protein [Sphingomonas formosensis]